jgi:glycosyltransferase involved in cell wall biosynthesis
MQYVTVAKRGTVRDQFNIPPSTPILLSVGRLISEKGFAELLEQFAASRIEARLIIVGEGELLDALTDRARALDISDKVLFVGWQDRAHIWDFYADADAFVLLSKVEALGLVFWEAMYMNVPVIGRPIGGIKETIGEDGLRGFFWDTPDGPAVFGEKLERCIVRGPNIEAITKRAKTYVSTRIGEVVT